MSEKTMIILQTGGVILANISYIRVSSVDQNLERQRELLKDKDILKLVRLKLYGDYYNLPLVNKLIKYILQLRISVNGLGRKEIVELVKTEVFSWEPSQKNEK